MPALPEAARFLSAAHGVPTLWAPDLRNKRQTAQILTSRRELLGTDALAGFFCGGEIGPVGGKAFLHGFMATLAVFLEP